MRSDDCHRITTSAALHLTSKHQSILIVLHRNMISCLIIFTNSTPQNIQQINLLLLPLPSFILLQPMRCSLVRFQHTSRGQNNRKYQCSSSCHDNILTFGGCYNNRDEYTKKGGKVDCCYNLFEYWICLFVLEFVEKGSKRK